MILWNGESNVIIELNNWSTAPQKLDKGQEIGLIEPMMLVGNDDTIWNDDKEGDTCVMLRGIANSSKLFQGGSEAIRECTPGVS